MGVLNVTPDSFSDGGLYDDLEKAVRQAHRLQEEGVDIIDLGGESTRPGTRAVPVEEERTRVIPVLKRLLKEIDLPISIDTYKERIVEESLDLGAHLINDITGLRGDSKLTSLIAKYKVPVIIMHMQGTPQNMQENPHYASLIAEILFFLKESIKKAEAGGINPENIIIDPGIGFGKTTAHNLEIIRRLNEFKKLNKPILIGTSRKSFIGDILNLPVEDRLEGTAATVAISIFNRVNIVRVHEGKAMVRVARMADALKRGI